MLEINGWLSWPPDSNIGLNLEFGKRPSWIITPLFTIVIRHSDDQDHGYYIPDYSSLKKHWKGWNVYKHYEPENNDRYFNLGFNSETFFFGSYEITRKKFKNNLPIIYDPDTYEQLLPRILCQIGFSHQEITEFKNSGGMKEAVTH